MIIRSCSCCLYQISFEDGAEKVVCPACGELNVPAAFESDGDLLKQSEEEKIRIENELKKTAEEKARLDEELRNALSNLDAISAEQVSGNQQLTALLNAVRADQQKAGGKQDALHDVLTALGGASDGHTEQLQKLGELSGKILESQNDLSKRFGMMNEVMAEVQQLKLDEQKKYELISQYTAWSMSIGREDAERLETIRSASRELLDHRASLDSSLSDLRKKSDEIRAELSSFHSEYTEDKRKKLTALFRTAEDLQAAKKYSKAETKYHEVVENGGDEAEVWWRILLCHYGVEYVMDDKAGAYVPTMYIPDLTVPDEMPEQVNFRRSLETAGAEGRAAYEKRLKALNAIIDSYRTVRFNESYDVFISVKQNDNGHITADSDKGSELYYLLRNWGLNVFNSRLTRLRPGVEFEPQIISALMSAKVMIVVGTKTENMEAKWVQNEWRRFQWLKKNDKENKRMLFCYLANGMKAEQIPAALDPSIQAIVEGIDSESRLRETMKAAFPDNPVLNPKAQTPPQPVYVPAEPQSAMTREAFEKKLVPMLIKRDFAGVIRQIDDLDTLELLTAKTVLFRVCAEKQISSVKQLLSTVPDLRGDEYIRTVSEYLSEDEAENLDKLLRENTAVSPKPQPVPVRETPEPEAERPKPQPAPVREAPKPEAERPRPQPVLPAALEAPGDAGYSELPIEEVRAAAAKNDAAAQTNLGARYFRGDGVPQNYILAFEWYRRAAMQGYAVAQNSLGYFHENGYGIRKDPAQAAAWYRKAAEQNYADAQHRLGNCYYNGFGVAKDLYEAIKWYRMAAEQGHAAAQNSLGARFFKGDGVMLNRSIAADWFERSALQGEALAQYNLGFCLENGYGVPYDPKRACDWYEKAAGQGHADAKEALERVRKALNETAPETPGSKIEVPAPEAPKNVIYAELPIEEVRAAAARNDAAAQTNLGARYFKGDGVPQDRAEAAAWYRKAAMQGNMVAQNCLGSFYENGCGVTKDPLQAVSWYRKAAMQDYSDSQYALGNCYWNGLGVLKDREKAIEWYRKAAGQGNAAAQNALGARYFGGNGVPQDRNAAAEWFKKAALQGHAMAQYNLGYCHENGYGVPRDLNAACEWYDKAARQGHEDAKAAVERVRNAIAEGR